MERNQLKYLLESLNAPNIKLSPQEKKIINTPKNKLLSIAKSKRFGELKKVIEPVAKKHNIKEIDKIASSNNPDYNNVKKEFINIVSKNFDKKTSEIIAIPLALMTVASDDPDTMKKDLKDKIWTSKTIMHVIVLMIVRWVYINVALYSSSYLVPLIPVSIILALYYLYSKWEEEQKSVQV